LNNEFRLDGARDLKEVEFNSQTSSEVDSLRKINFLTAYSDRDKQAFKDEPQITQ